MFESIIDYLNRKRGTSFSPVSEGVFEGYALVDNKQIKLSIDLCNGFPFDFPVIRVVESTSFTPHVSMDGSICLANKEEVIIKATMPDELLVDSYDRAVAILALNPEAQEKEIFKEFGTYWENRSVPRMRLYLNLPLAKKHEYQEFTAIGHELDRLVVSTSIDESKMLLVNHMNCSKEETEKYRLLCTRIRLRETAVPPQLNENDKFTWKSIRTYIQNNLTGSQKKQFERLLATKTKSIHRLILLVIPSDNGDQYACLWLHSKESKLMSIKNTAWCKVDAVAVSRIDQSYMLARGGANTDLSNKAVLLIGAGSVGGFLAENLCQCGIGTLDILDKDKLTVDNVHRHVLGFDDAMRGSYKADLLKAHLETRFPYVEIDSLNFENRSVDALLEKPERLLNYDLVICATGNPNVDLALNDTMYKLDGKPPLVVCFNEPYGIGGHAIAVLADGACLRCMYSDAISGELVPFQGSFVEPDQSFSKTLSGCAGSFVEYSVLDSQQTAIVATRLSIDVLNGTCQRSRLVSWLGSDDKMRQEGFVTSELYQEQRKGNLTSVVREILRNERCTTCGR